MITRGKLPAYRIAGEYRFSQEDLEKFLKSQRVVVTPAGPNHPMAKFTERSRKVLTLARDEARRYNHAGVGTEHLLLGLLREEDDIAGQILRKAGVTIEGARKLVKQILSEPEQPGVVAEALADTGYKSS